MGKKDKTGQCVYCGKVRVLTKDHIPPKCFFSKPRPSNLITVPSCKECNLGRSKDDEYLRFVLAYRFENSNHPDVMGVVPAIHRAFKREANRAFTRSIVKDIIPLEDIYKKGEFLGKTYGYYMDVKRADRIVTQIIKGLYYHDTGRILKPNITITVGMEGALNNITDKFIFDTEITLLNNTNSIGNVLTYGYRYVEESETDSFWVLEFYNRIRFFGVVDSG